MLDRVLLAILASLIGLLLWLIDRHYAAELGFPWVFDPPLLTYRWIRQLCKSFAWSPWPFIGAAAISPSHHSTQGDIHEPLL